MHNPVGIRSLSVNFPSVVRTNDYYKEKYPNLVAQAEKKSSSFLPEQIGFGNAAFLARELGLQCGAWNLDATCASTPVAFQTACALVQTGAYRN